MTNLRSLIEPHDPFHFRPLTRARDTVLPGAVAGCTQGGVAGVYQGGGAGYAMVEPGLDMY